MKRLAVILAVSLLFGAVMNVIVAWTLFLRLPYSPGKNNFAWGEADRWPVSVPAKWPQRPQSYERLRDRGRSLTTYSTEPHNISINYIGFHQLTLVDDWRCGWPMRSLRCVIRASNVDDQGAHITGMFDVVELGGRTPDSLRSLSTWRADYLPTSPMLLGFAVNSLVFAAVPALPILLLGSVRRFLRLRAGLCPACKYPIGGSPVCTECGRAIPQRKLTE